MTKNRDNSNGLTEDQLEIANDLSKIYGYLDENEAMIAEKRKKMDENRQK